MTPCRLIVDPPLEGAWNMAVDEALLEDAAERGTATLRFYQWAEPTLSLGYFQSYDERRTHAASRAAAVVRRSSGGGALMHDRELTYSLSVPAPHPLARQSAQLYRVVHKTLIAALAQWRLAAAMYGDVPPACLAPPSDEARTGANQPGAAEPFLCFDRRAEADVILTKSQSSSPAAKICGSAQRRRRGAVLQHGGVLLGRSAAAPELPGLEEAGAARIEPAELVRRWTPKLAGALQLTLLPQALPAELMESAQQLHRIKYGAQSWTLRR
ncbi:MAG: lipoate--protein ligase family protein [Pirellulales bacterium]|nr:lipoate--protein ligase family protein [Pirellulales bacterium]